MRETGPVHQAYAHDAVVALASGADLAAPGAAITTELCGHWQHPPPCPVAAHHTAAERDGDSARLRVLFATEPAREAEVRARIEAALAARWEVRSSRAGTIETPEERRHAARLTAP